MITAHIIANSAYSWSGSRLATFVLSYPRFVHAELLTHRVFSRNSSSSRAIPISKMIERATNATAMPVYWGKNQKGMQAKEELTGKDLERAKNLWHAAADTMAGYAQQMSDIGVHKQIANRLIENFQNIETVVTSSTWSNFYALRNHKDAQPEIKALAEKMVEAHQVSTPRLLKEGEWHLPFVTEDERANLKTDVALMVSAARCARVSYLTHDGVAPALEKDMALFETLMGGEIKHASPTEHQARPSGPHDFEEGLVFRYPSNLGNNWVQFRQTIPGNNIVEYNGFR